MLFDVVVSNKPNTSLEQISIFSFTIPFHLYKGEIHCFSRSRLSGRDMMGGGKGKGEKFFIFKRGREMTIAKGIQIKLGQM